MPRRAAGGHPRDGPFPFPGRVSAQTTVRENAGKGSPAVGARHVRWPLHTRDHSAPLPAAPPWPSRSSICRARRGGGCLAGAPQPLGLLGFRGSGADVPTGSGWLRSLCC